MSESPTAPEFETQPRRGVRRILGVRWFSRTTGPGDTHRGEVADGGVVMTACGVQFDFLLAGQRPMCTRLPWAEQVCRACMATVFDTVLLPATCLHRTPELVLSLTVSYIGDGTVRLSSHQDAGCVLTVDATLLADVLGMWQRRGPPVVGGDGEQ